MAEGSDVIKGKNRVPWSAVLSPLIANVLAILLWMPLLSVANGGSIRPMVQSAALFAIAFPAAIFGSFIAFAGIPNGVRRPAGWLCFIFSYTPFAVGLLTLRVICAHKSLTLAP